MVLYRIHHPFSALSHPFFGAHHPQASFETSFRMLGSAIKVRRWNTVAMWPKIKGDHTGNHEGEEWQHWNRSHVPWSGKRFEKVGNQKQDEKTRCNTAIFTKFDSDLLVFACRFSEIAWLLSNSPRNECTSIACRGNLAGKIGNHKGSIPFCKETCQPLNGSLSSTDLQLIIPSATLDTFFCWGRDLRSV